jgi:eukaryotic-like serine/threonine-protein kinase
MDPTRWKIIDELIDQALEQPEEAREEFIYARTPGDPKLRDEVLGLLRAQKDGDTFLLKSAMNMAAKTLADTTKRSPDEFINRKIASYQIERPIGAGGMGEVYLAFDEKLKRKVALKMLPAEYGSNDERVKRFEIEARAISSLNHPGIVTIYDVGNFEGVNYIATEFVEGKTLRDLMGGSFKLRNILLNSIQICDALAAAHKEGIIHRDIKPENIMIRNDGYAKILDFGLAKLSEIGPETRELAKTSKGVIIGTPAYMSPAQVSDETIDHRTDLWSCGVVLYEFLGGKHPFKGSNRQETFEAILSKDPPPCSSLNGEVPVELDRILAKLLEKDPGMSYQSAADLRADLKRVKREIDSSTSWAPEGNVAGSAETSSRSRIGTVALVLSSLAILAGAAFAGYYFLTKPERDPAAIDWSTAKNTKLTDQVGTEFFPSISPDGRDFVYTAADNDDLDIFSQRIGGKNRLNITANSTADDTQPAYSPNGEFIAFRSERSPKGIYVMGASGENPRFVSELGFHPSWSPSGKEIVVSTFGRDQPTVRPSAGTGKLVVIDIDTGAKRDLIRLDASFPTWSPNGKRIAYWFYTGTHGRRNVATIPADGGEPVVVAKDFAVSNWNPVWSPDGRYLYFVSSRAGNMNFWRVRIDQESGEEMGEPEAVTTPSQYSRHLSLSRDGRRMLYVDTNNRSNIQGVEFDSVAGRAVGSASWITQGDREIARAELSPAGTDFLMRLIRPTQDDIVTVSRDGSQWRDVTNDEPFDRYARWSPDGTRIAFGSDRTGAGQVWIANADGTGLRQLTFKSENELATGFPVWSPAGDRLAVYFNGVTSLLDPNLSENDQTPPTLPQDGIHRLVVWDWSPDGKKLAGVIAVGERRHIGYFSFETNQYHIVVENSDEVPAWLPDSRRFIYSVREKIFLADIVTKESREIFSNPEVEIRSPFVSRDGKLLYYTASNAESDIWLLDLPEKSETPAR